MAIKLAQRVQRIGLSATDEIDNIVKRMQRSGVNDIISFGGGEPCFDTPDSIKICSIQALLNGKTKYELTAGDFELREEISKKLKRKNGISAGVEEILVTPGGKFAIYLAFHSLLEPGDKIILFEPAWVSYASIAELAGAEIASVSCSAENNFHPDLNELRQKMDDRVRMIIVNTPNNPTGAVFSAQELREIGNIATHHGAAILADEVYEDIIFAGTHFSLASEFENVITVHGFSKSYAMTGWRLGYLSAQREIVDAAMKIYQQSATCVNAFAQAGALAALKNPSSEDEVIRMVKHYQELGTLFYDLVDESGLFSGKKPQGAFYAFPAFTFKRSSLEVAQILLEKAHVATVPGSAFGACGEGHLRFAYATSKDNIIEAFDRMKTVRRSLV